MYRLITFFVFLLSIVATAQSIKFSVSAPTLPKVGETVKVNFTLTNEKGDLSPSLFKLEGEVIGGDILAGPMTSQSSTVTVTDGKEKKVVSVTYSYTIQVKEATMLYIPSASVVQGGKVYTTATQHLIINGKSAKKERNKSDDESAKKVEIALDDMKLRAITSKTKVGGDETITLTYRLYALRDISQIQGVQYPTFEGFEQKKISLSKPLEMKREAYQGKSYQAVDFYKVELTPNRSGTIIIPPLTMDVVVRVGAGKSGDTFFGSEQIMEDRNVKIQSNPLDISVISAPQREIKKQTEPKVTVNEKNKAEERNDKLQSSKRKGVIKKNKK